MTPEQRDSAVITATVRKAIEALSVAHGGYGSPPLRNAVLLEPRSDAVLGVDRDIPDRGRVVEFLGEVMAHARVEPIGFSGMFVGNLSEGDLIALRLAFAEDWEFHTPKVSSRTLLIDAYIRQMFGPGASDVMCEYVAARGGL